MLYTLRDFEVEISKKHLSLFNEPLQIPDKFDLEGNSILRHDKIVFDHFLDSYTRLNTKQDKNVREIFYKENGYAAVYFFLGESSRLLKRTGHKRSLCLKILDKTFIINNKPLYCLFALIIDKLKERKIPTKAFGFPKAFKHFSYDGYFRQFVGLTKVYEEKPKLFKAIFNPNIGDKKGVLNQTEALKRARKIRFSELSELCKNYHNGEWLVYFKTEKGFKTAVDKLYTKCKKDIIKKKRLRGSWFDGKMAESLLKAQRITKKSCARYLRYLALMSVIQSRVNRPIEINSVNEKKYFSNGYKILSDACESLSFKVCVDKTFYRGIRSRTYQVRVMTDKLQKFKYRKVELNNIESEFYSIKDEHDKVRKAMGLGTAGRYVMERAEAYEKMMEARQLQIKSFKIVDEKCVKSRWWELLNKTKCDRIKVVKDIDNFFDKYKDSKIYKTKVFKPTDEYYHKWN